MPILTSSLKGLEERKAEMASQHRHKHSSATGHNKHPRQQQQRKLKEQNNFLEKNRGRLVQDRHHDRTLKFIVVFEKVEKVAAKPGNGREEPRKRTGGGCRGQR